MIFIGLDVVVLLGLAACALYNAKHDDVDYGPHGRSWVNVGRTELELSEYDIGCKCTPSHTFQKRHDNMSCMKK